MPTMQTVEVTMYSTRFCPYCMMARRLLKSKGIEYKEIPVGSNHDLWAEMEKLSGRSTVPQIIINNEPVGGYDDIARLNQTGELDQLLGV